MSDEVINEVVEFGVKLPDGEVIQNDSILYNGDIEKERESARKIVDKDSATSTAYAVNNMYSELGVTQEAYAVMSTVTTTRSLWTAI